MFPLLLLFSVMSFSLDVLVLRLNHVQLVPVFILLNKLPGSRGEVLAICCAKSRVNTASLGEGSIRLAVSRSVGGAAARPPE